MRRANIVSGGIVWRRISSQKRECGRAHVDHHLAHVLAVDRELAVERVPARRPPRSAPGRASAVISSSVGSKKPIARERGAQALRVAVDPGAHHRQLRVDLLARDLLRHAEVEERDAPVRQQQVVAGVRVGREAPRAVQRPEEEAEHDLAEPVALGLRQLLHLLEADALDVLGDQHVLARQAR